MHLGLPRPYKKHLGNAKLQLPSNIQYFGVFTSKVKDVDARTAGGLLLSTEVPTPNYGLDP